MNDLAALMRRKREDAGRRTSLFEGVSPGNVGNVFQIAPADLQFINTASQNAYGRPVRVLEIVGDDALGEMLCVSLQQQTILNAEEGPVIAGASERTEGPLVGVVEWGSGAGLASFEFDIPSPNSFPSFVRQSPPSPDSVVDLSVAPRANGVLLTLPASSLRLYLRNDALAPYLLNLESAPASLNRFVTRPATVRVHSTYGRRPDQSKLTRSYPICFSSTGGTAPTTAYTAGQLLFLGVPSYASKLWFPRSPINTTTLSITIFQGPLTATTGETASRGPYIVPAGSEGGIDIRPYDTFVRITNPAGNPSISDMTAVFDLAI